ncbi:MAG: alpha-glucan family phosphorylase [Desulfotomaculaceae bacterium]|nr:alpha-glucan family phosphorylase [Desulfotomaculaceae bacterium]
MFPFRVVSVTPKLPAAICRLKELAYDFWFSWKPEAVELFRTIKPDLWRESGHNPARFLIKVSSEDLERVAGDDDYLAMYRRVFELYDSYKSEETWFAKHYPEHKEDVIAYFSAEFGLHESHPIYSGGLGLLAGDHCKSASDLGLPFVGVGLLYKNGYFTQKINSEGRQEAVYPHLNFIELPITPVYNSKGSQLTVKLEMPGRDIYILVWKVKVGRIWIYLLDADTPKNTGDDRRLTGTLYGGDQQYRISQEILLGVGGVKALCEMGIVPHVWHINEGHAAFLILQRLKELVAKGLSFNTAREVVRASTIFTTHTPVPAGHDVFSKEIIRNFFEPAAKDLGIDLETLLELAWDRERQGFNMTLLALNNSCLCNGVSRLHGKVSRKMFLRYYDGLHQEEIPVTTITNGVHIETWLARELRDLYFRYLGKECVEKLGLQVWGKVDNIPDEELWRVHRFLKVQMIDFVRSSLKRQRMRNFELSKRIQEVDEYLSADILTIGFARRFATYKRATLLFRDRERLTKLVNHPERPVRFIFAGKAHPADMAGQDLIKRIYDLSNEPQFRGKILVLENYDIHVARHLLHGVDVWMNTPRRPMEASGTSGQKAALNGLINISTLDGWWPEAYDGNNGFAVGTECNFHNEETQDQEDCHSLFMTLEEKLIPMYYRREAGLPQEWVRMMKHSIKTIAPVFNTNRMVSEYTDRFYIPAARRGMAFRNNNFEQGERVSRFKKLLREYWDQIKFAQIETNGAPKMYAGQKLEVKVDIHLGQLDHGSVAVELVYGNALDYGLKHIERVVLAQVGEISPGVHRFSGSLVLPQGGLGYTVRVRPASPDFPYTELPLVKWAPGF